MTAALHALILTFFYLLISALGYPGLIVFQHQNIFLIKKQAAGTLHQQRAAGEAQQTHSVEITIKLSGESRGTNKPISSKQSTVKACSNFLYLRLTPEGASPNGVEPKRVFLAVVRPFGSLSADRIAAVTKELLPSAGIGMELFGAHTTRALGLALVRALGLSAEQAAEIGSLANLQAFSLACSRVGVADVLSDALQHVSYVQTRPSTCCGAADSPVTPSGNDAYWYALGSWVLKSAPW